MIRRLSPTNLGTALLVVLAFSTSATAQAEPDPLAAATEEIRAGNLVDAERRLRDLAERGEDPRVLELLGVVLARTGRADEARRTLEAAASLDPRRPGPLQHLARLQLVAGEEAAGDEATALDLLRRAAELGDLDRDLALHLARGELAAGRHGAAEAALGDLVERFDSVHARLLMARLLLETGRAEAALGQTAEALSKAPSSEDLLSLHARAALAARRPVRALFPLESLVRMIPESADYPYLLGVARMQVGLLPEAEEVLERAARTRGDHALTHIALGLVLNRSKHYDRAADALRRALLLAPENAEALAALAEAYVGLDELARAEDLALRALDREPGHPTAELALGRVRMDQGRFAEARDAFNRAVEAEPDSAAAHYQLSLALARLGDREGSERHRRLHELALDAVEAHLLELREMTPHESSPPLEDR